MKNSVIMPPAFDISDRIVAITGGAGQLGRQFTHSVLAAGGRVVCLDLKCNLVAPSERLLVVSADVTSRSSMEQALTQIESAWGEPPHALINNAALDSPPGASALENGPFEDYPLESWKKVMDVNVTGVFLCCQVLGGAMARVGRGSIINIASIYGLISPDQRIYEYRQIKGEPPFFKPAVYSASKSALLNLTRYLATYWAGKNVRVNTLTLGGVFNSQDEDFLKGYHARVPLGRMARADEYNAAVHFLVSEASSYMTGSNMVLDGGWTAW